MWILGWLAPDGEFFECDYMGHTTMAEEICKKLNYHETDFPSDMLLQKGWCHLTCTTFHEHKWVIFCPWGGRHLTQPQIDFLRPYIQKWKDWLSDSSITDLKYDMPEVFEAREKRYGQ